MNNTHLLPASCALLFSLGLLGCGASQVHLDPRSVTALTLKPLTQEATFCPGSPIRVEVRASLKDGSQCSSSDASAACMGEKGALIDTAQIRYQGSTGGPARAGEELFWMPPRDAMATAEKGLSLLGWLESTGKDGAVHRSPAGKIELRPVYDCLQDNMFTYPPPQGYGASGGPGPDLLVSATLITTPFYREAMLIRVSAKAGTTYILATDRTKPVTVFSKGQSGAQGRWGVSGQNGPDGAPAGTVNRDTCEPGRPGMNGIDGTAGSNGGDGGIGGMVQLFIDEAVGDKLQGWLKVGSIGGDGGHGGPGGAGGAGGQGSGHSDNPGCSAAEGRHGKSGARGADGEPGRPGPHGPPVVVATAPRQALFSAELPLIQRLAAGSPEPVHDVAASSPTPR